MKLSELARAIKELELIKWRLVSGCYKNYDKLIDVANKGGKNYVAKMPVQYYYVNEFPFCSAFCYVFRRFQIEGNKIVKKDPPYTEFKCLCPMSDFNKNCHLDSDGKHLPENFIIDKVESISISKIAKYLKKMQIQKYPYIIHKINGIWSLHIKHNLPEYQTKDDRS